MTELLYNLCVKVAVIVILILVLAGAAILYQLNSNPASAPAPIYSPQPKTEYEASSSAAPLSGYGSYLVGWGEEAFLNSEAEKVVLFFYADWCPTCRPIDAEFKERMTEFPKNLQVYRISYNDSETTDKDRALAQKYGVTYQHTFVQIDKQGNEITKWNGGGLDNLLSKIK